VSLVVTDEQTSLVATCASSALANAVPVSSARPSPKRGQEVHSPQIAAKLAVSAGAQRTGGEPFAPADHVTVAVADDAGGDVARIR
jgi:hypothetical protein